MTRRIQVGAVPVGGGAAVSIQSMCNTPTEDVNATVRQIQRLEQAGSELDKLVGVRTRQIQRRLSAVTKLPEAQAAALLDGEDEEGPAAE